MMTAPVDGAPEAPDPTGSGLTGSQKAAAVLLALGPDRAARLLSFLTETEVEQVTLEIAGLGQLTPQQTNAVLEEFRTEAMAAQYLVSGGVDHARMILRTLHGDAGDDIVDRLLASFRTTPFHFLQMHDPHEVLQQLREENPQTLALVLSHLPTRFGAQILSGLDPHLQIDVATRIAQLERTSPEVVQKVETSLQRRFGDVRRRGATSRGGVKELASILNSADRGTERAILARLEETSPELAEEVRALMFVFEDIVVLEDRAVQEVLRQVDLKRLAYAMKGVPPSVNEKVFANLSERARETLAEEVELLGPTPLREVEAAQSEVVALIRRLEEEGAITTTRGTDGGMVE
jgi:flagellar motor switch protein FliG